ncbi:MAG: peptidase M48 [Spirochaetae bacterium HGW-Spirochaetae-1]|jgi:Zn-dependent protease with chaperone function|nr:MAG: peptidase M48 [Spirochaetae bacterium HGW-Spirochaetae-1]
MGKGRWIFFVLIITAGAGLAALFYLHKPQPKLDSTLAPAYMLLGHATRGISRALTEIIAVDSLDEKEYGEAIKARCDDHNDSGDKDYVYVNAVMSQISRFARKPFPYRVYMHESSSPNAFALPGGVIFVTRGLIKTLKSEAELAAILSHEMGHIELSHCLDVVRFQLLAGKTGNETLGKVADFAMNLLLRHSFSKTQENDADNYAFELLINSKYDPGAEGRAFARFLQYMKQNGMRDEREANIIRDYFMSHPPMVLREEKFSEKAGIWWRKHDKEIRYVGTKNLKKRTIEAIDSEYIGPPRL